MNEIKCPHCGEVFQVDEAGYAAIVQQVRSQQFDDEIKSREQAIHRELEAEQKIKLAAAESEKKEALAEKDREITRLNEQSKQADQQKQYAVNSAVNKKEQEILQLRAEIQKLEADNAARIAELRAQYQQQDSQKAQEILRLEGRLNQAAAEKELAVNTAVQESEKQILQLQSDLANEQQAAQISEQKLRESHKTELALKDDQIAQLKDFKARQSTKMIGESLEQHCLIEFNKVRMMAFPRAEFGKDNDARTGSKGDFIYRENTEDGIELLSIMFEMKNEMDTTATKHKNEDFFKELDKDRREKNCEYAVLVTLLEADNEYYNTGIVDVSYQYPKMYVIRPQFFIPFISLLRNAALNAADARRELELTRQQNIDVTKFEDKILKFKSDFAYNYEQAHKRFNDAITAIDKSINDLEKAREALMKSDNQLRLANNKADELSIKKLVHGNPTMRALLIEAGADVTK